MKSDWLAINVHTILHDGADSKSRKICLKDFRTQCNRSLKSITENERSIAVRL